jgi:DNA polymerase-1
MIVIRDTIARDHIVFKYCESKMDLKEAWYFAKRNSVLAFDTEATHWDCYRPGWKLRTFQFSDDRTCYVVPASQRRFIAAICELPIKWIGHNGPHDKRSIDQWLGYETAMDVPYETFILAHHYDPRNRAEGGVNHGLKEQAAARIDPESGKWEKALKTEFRRIRVPIPGQYFRSGKRKGEPKDRVARIDEGWGLIDACNPVYIAYAGSDPILTYRVAQWYQRKNNNPELYDTDWKIAQRCSQLQTRGMLHDRRYTLSYKRGLEKAIAASGKRLAEYGITSVYSTQQLAEVLMEYGVELTERTPKGKYKVDTKIMKDILTDKDRYISHRPDVEYILKQVFRYKRCSKRLSAYANQVLVSADVNGRIHPSIKSLGARTGRMSVSTPAFQQLPTKED